MNVLKDTVRRIERFLVSRRYHRLVMCVLHTKYLLNGRRNISGYAKALASEVAYMALDLRKRRRCPICSWGGWEFSPVYFSENYRPASRCPACMTCERHRLLSWFLARADSPEIRRNALGNVLVVGIALEETFLRHVFPNGYRTLDITARLAPDIVADIQQIPTQADMFDAILCFRVLEHVDDPDGALREFSRVLKPGGTLFLSVPLYDGMRETIRYGGDRENAERGPTWSYPDHSWDFTIADLDERIRKSGLSCTMIEPDPEDELQRAYKTQPHNDRVGRMMDLRYLDVVFCCSAEAASSLQGAGEPASI